jgi:glycosyltransferase involved in cell wall biosynthesis
MDYRPNVDAVLWFANDIFPLIQRERPEAQFVIVGQKPTEAVKQLGERNGIVVTGAVDDIRPHLAEAAVYVAPLRMGGGTRFKLLEAMALKRPIVSTRVGAEGFEVQDGRELLLADRPDDFAKAVLTLLGDPAKQGGLINAAYAFVKGYDWGEIIPAMEAALAGGRG